MNFRELFSRIMRRQDRELDSALNLISFSLARLARYDIFDIEKLLCFDFEHFQLTKPQERHWSASRKVIR